MTVAVKAQDEFGLKDLDLHYSVNGGPENTVRLLKQPGDKQASGSSVLALEDFKLVPGRSRERLRHREGRARPSRTRT